MDEKAVMSDTLDLNAIKTHIYRTVLEDGLLEIMMGIYLLLSGFYINNKFMILYYLWLPIALILMEIIRRRYVYPRSGYVKISFSAIQIIAILGSILVGTVILATLIALTATGIGHPIKGNWREIISYALIFLLVISFCFIAYRFKTPRWYMHGISTGIIFLISKTLAAHGLVLGLGIWITLVGVYVFIRFLRHFPIEPDNISDVEPQAEEITDASI